MSDIDYLETAKKQIAKIEGNNPVEYIKVYSLVAITYALIAIAEKLYNARNIQ